MRKLIYIFVLLFTSLNIISCEFDIDYNKELPKDKLVVSCFLEADSTINISISKTSRPGTYNYDNPISESFVKGAKVDLFIDNIFKESLNSAISDNNYRFNYIPKTNEKIDIKIDYKNFDQVRGSGDLGILPPNLDSSSINFRIDSNDQGILPNIILYVEFSSLVNEDNYYRIDGDFILNYLESGNWYEMDIKLEELILDWENIKGVYYGKQPSDLNPSKGNNKYRVFSNKFFKNNIYKARFIINPERIYFSQNPVSYNIKGNLKVSKLEKKIFDYLYTLNKVNSGFSTSSEPVIIANGVENGYGFIGARKSINIKLEASY